MIELGAGAWQPGGAGPWLNMSRPDPVYYCSLMKKHLLTLSVAALSSFTVSAGVLVEAVVAEVELGRGATYGLDSIPESGTMFEGKSLDEFVAALEASRGIAVLNRPHAFTESGKRVSIHSGRRIPVMGDGDEIAFEEVVMGLDLLPVVGKGGEVVSLEVDFKDDRIVGETLKDGHPVPVISTQELSSRIELPNEAIMVLGGIVSERPAARPIVSAIPGLKRIAGTRTAKFETLIFLKPRVLTDEEAEAVLAAKGATVEAPPELAKRPRANPLRRQSRWRR